MLQINFSVLSTISFSLSMYECFYIFVFVCVINECVHYLHELILFHFSPFSSFIVVKSRILKQNLCHIDNKEWNLFKRELTTNKKNSVKFSFRVQMNYQKSHPFKMNFFFKIKSIHAILYREHSERIKVFTTALCIYLVVCFIYNFQ